VGRLFRNLANQLGVVSLVSVIILILMTLAGIFAPFFVKDPFAISGNTYLPPTYEHPAGTDSLGRDVLSRILVGTRTALYVGLGAATLSSLLGTVIGGLAGFRGGWVDELLSRLIEIFLVMPIFFLLILVVSLFGANIMFTVIAIGAVTWPRNARIMRAQALSLKETTFCKAAVVSGASTSRILFFHIIPNGIAPVIASSALLIGSAVLIEAGLSFLGLGDPNIISWGGMIRDGRKALTFAPWLSLFPGLALVVFAAAMSFLGDRLSHILNPELSKKTM